MSELYILNENKIPVPVNLDDDPIMLMWGSFMQKEDRIVAKTKVGDAYVSTVFLGVNHNFSGKGPPILWETMVFGGKHDQEWMDRCSGTWEQAEAMHQNMVNRLKRDLHE